MASKPLAYSFPVKPTTSGPDESGSISQSSPTWLLTFVRWNVRDTLRTPTTDPLAVRDVLIVENDCTSVSVTDSKGTLTTSFSATLMQTDVNYETAIEPGDFVFVNMLNWPSDAQRVAKQVRSSQPINGVKDGFKGFFKIQSVRKSVAVVDASTGAKSVQFKIDGFAFTEFNNSIYFNPNLINQKDLSNQALFINNISDVWGGLIKRSGTPFVQEVIALLIQSFIGSGFNPKATSVGGLVISPNVHFAIPTVVGKLLGVVIDDLPDSTNYASVVAAKDVYNYLFGIQRYTTTGTNSALLTVGMTPSNLQSAQRYPGFYYTDIPCQGNTLLKPEYWNNVKAWSILNQYTNSPLNELYSCFRVAKNNRVMPTLVFRQIPFSSEDFVQQTFGTQDSTANNIPFTRYMTLPRWKIDPAMVLMADIGRDEAARINFVQYYARSNFSNKGIETSGETAARNFVFDNDDIKRSGLRPYIVQNQFDDVPDVLTKLAPQWARILGDAIIGGHLKMNGTISCVGIVDPIAVGDNLEFDNTVYHIEQVSHAAVMLQNGAKSFRTTISVSHGVSVNSNSSGTKYSEMAFSDAYLSREDDAKHNSILPGVSESQDTLNRPNNLDVANPPDGNSNTSGFPQPSLTKNDPGTGE